MFKRLKNKENRGFSMVETLAVVAILVILLGLSVVGAAYYRDYLKITELDNAAREIYMAAENRAVLLNGGGQLDSALAAVHAAPLAERAGEGEEENGPVYITHEGGKNADGSALGGLLTSGAIDPALLKGDFHIVYDPASGAVTDVFYTEKNGIQLIKKAFALAAKGRDARMRPEEGPMLGYYGGEQAAREDYTPLPAPEVMVVVENGDMLRVHVTFSVPDSALSAVGNNWRFTAKQIVELKYGDEEPVTLMFNPGSSKTPPKEIARAPQTTTSQGNSSITYTWVLDALDWVDETEDGDKRVEDRHFWQLFADQAENAPACGGDFTVTAEIELFASGRRSASASGSDTGNSLFAERSGGEIARVENLRHLQNLDTQTSNAGGKTGALQLADVDCCGKQGRVPYGKYEFRPIDNKELESFDGGRYEITDLHVKSAGDKSGAGLFAGTRDGMKFTGVRLVEAEVASGGDKAAGALVGAAGSGCEFRDIRVVNSKAVSLGGPAGGVAGSAGGGSSFTDCRVYWEPERDLDPLRSLLGSDQEANPYKYDEIIRGASAGGLAGELSGTGGVTVTKSLAAALVKGTEAAGGLIGSAPAAAVTLEHSYADCYLTGGGAAGLIGGLGGSGTITDCYAAGFIDMNGADAAAGLTLGTGGITTERAYSVMWFTNQKEDIQPYMISEAQESSTLKSTYYLGSGEVQGSGGTKAEGWDYSSMSSAAFLDKMGKAAFELKGLRTGTESRDTNPYNLQEKQDLTKYSFPGLKDLPHYGDWIAYFKEPSLVYFEEYDRDDKKTGEKARGFSGGNARTLDGIGELEDAKSYPTVKTDGYAVALLENEKWNEVSRFEVTYYQVPYRLNEKGELLPVEGVQESYTVTYVKDEPKPGSGEVKLLKATWTRQEGTDLKTDHYVLAPLPTGLVPGSWTTQDFYQYLRFEGTVNGKDNASGEYFYNPHFAETVKPYVPMEDGGKLINWAGTPESRVQTAHQYITEALTPGSRPVSVSVRTPRHLFHLSQYEDYYNNVRLSFQQGLPLDGYQSIYEGYLNIGLLEHDNRGFQIQSPIGTQAKPFLGTYDGNCLPIRRVAFQIPENEKNRVCAGLFGSSGGTLKNIVYSLNPNPDAPQEPEGEEQKNEPRLITFPSNERDTYLGALVGLNTLNGTVSNCAVDSVSLTSQIYTSKIYIGGLCGGNEGVILNSAAESAYLHVDASNYGTAYVGGLVGSNSKQIETSYAVGRLSAVAAQENAPVLLAGFVGLNTGAVSGSYAAMNLITDGVKAEAWGFSGQTSGGRQTGTYYLNDGNFSYRGEPFLAKYEEKGGARPIAYVDLTAETSPVPGMSTKNSKDPERVFPYPTGVKANGAAEHYGQWPKPMKLGTMGVYYWEELKVPGKALSYHVSLLAVDPGEKAASPKTVTRLSTLSTGHDEGGEVTRYGYGVYNKENMGVTLEDTPLPLLYSRDGGVGGPLTQELFAELEGEGSGLDKTVDEELARLMSYGAGRSFQFHSFPSYDQSAIGAGGLYPNASSAAPNGTLTLHQGGDQQVTISFALNPLFADALAVELPKAGSWTVKNVSVFTSAGDEKSGWTLTGDFPGSGNNTYDVRCIDQLQFIDWNSVHRNTTSIVVPTIRLIPAIPDSPVLSRSNKAEFPYLSHYVKDDEEGAVPTGKYYWTQTYDILGEKEADGTTYKKYTPIAEYYDTTTNEVGNLEAWFGGTYNGGSYKIENVNIEGQVSSTAGLFGVVFDARLKDIVLYSSDGKGTISTKAAIKTGEKVVGQTKSLWYSMGALAGVAGSSDKTESSIDNCSVAGYTIEATTYTAPGGFGGSNIGGMVGSSHMKFSNCSAVTTIRVHDAIENDNMRIGGLAGVCQGTLQSCYAGGSIELDPSVPLLNSTKAVYVGGLVSGSYMKPLKVTGAPKDTYIGTQGNGAGSTINETNNYLYDCYSYVKLPPLLEKDGGHPNVKSMYAIGGTGEIYPAGTPGAPELANHGECHMDNCYFLTSEALANYGGSEETYLEAIKDTGAKTDLGVKSEGGTGGGGTGGGETGSGSGEYEVGKEYDALEVFGGNAWPVQNGSNYYWYNRALYPTFGNNVPVFTMSVDGASGKDIATFAGYVTNYVDDSNWSLDTSSQGGPDEPDDTDRPLIGLTYEQLSGPPPEKDKTDPVYQIKNGKTIYELLPADFQPVTTTTDDGVSVPGKYSYPTQAHPELRDRNYPFPTIVTKEDGKYRVHYGDWPLKGFRRQTLFDEEGGFSLLGGSPIEIDLFASKGEKYQEYLVLTDGVGKEGEWSFTWDSVKALGGDASAELIARAEKPVRKTADEIPNIPEKEEENTYYLFEVQPLRDGTDVLYISYTYQDGKGQDVTCTLSVTVHVTAVAELRPSYLYMFPNDVLDVTVRAATKDGESLENVLEDGRLVLRGNPNCQNTGYLSAETLRAEAAEEGGPAIRFTTTVPEDAPDLEKSLILGANADFAYQVPGGQSYGGGSGGDIRIEIIQPWKNLEDWMTFETVEEADGTTHVVCTVSFPNSHPIYEAEDLLGTLRFAQFGSLSVDPMPPEQQPTAAWKAEEGKIALTLTYPEGVTLDAGIPETTVYIPLKLTSGEADGQLIEGEQIHTLTLNVTKPAAETENIPEPFRVEALPPAGDGQDGPARRRRWKREYRRRYALRREV